ncbi:MAG: cupin domain-containing protein [Solobacterium sp.]|jgi:mannose-6-phosphate isomerase-like protein (cupin superfamily)|nr:cupin domain-containing protein [Solobacterium sp.]
MKAIRGKDAVYNDKGNGSSLAEFIGRTAEIRRSNYAIAETRLTKGASEEKHHHVITEEVYMFVKGSCRMKINGETECFSAGDLLVAEPGDEHEIIEALEDTGFWVLTVPAFDPGDYIVG